MTCCGHGFKEYAGRDFSTSALGAFGQLVLDHLNPVKARLAKRPEDWPWSSVHDYTGNLTDAPVTPSDFRSIACGCPPTRIHAFEGVPQSNFSRRKITLRYAASPTPAGGCDGGHFLASRRGRRSASRSGTPTRRAICLLKEQEFTVLQCRGEKGAGALFSSTGWLSYRLASPWRRQWR